MVTLVGLAVPLASPLQLVNDQPVDGTAVSCTAVLNGYEARSGSFVTAPFPTVEMASVKVLTVNVAVRFLFAIIGTVSGFADAVVSPLQPTKLYPVPGVAVAWTSVPCVYVAWFGFLDAVPL